MTAVDQPGWVLTGRDRAILAAVGAGRAELSYDCEPDLIIDGLFCSDQQAAYRLIHNGLIAATTTPNALGSRVAAVLTAIGSMVLSGSF